jgi:hypothetical protein
MKGRKIYRINVVKTARPYRDDKRQQQASNIKVNNNNYLKDIVSGILKRIKSEE